MSYVGNTPTSQAFTAAVDYFSGNGSTTAFTLSRPVASVAQVQAVIENVPQNPGSAYTVSGNVITFTSTPPSGTNNIYVYYTSPITQVAQPSQGTVGLSQLSATGTPSSSTYLRGDNTWGAVTSAFAGKSGQVFQRFTGTGSVSGNTLTITAVSSGALTIGSIVTGTNITANSTITAFGTGTGGTGTYTLSASSTAASTTVSSGTATFTVPAGVSAVKVQLTGGGGNGGTGIASSGCNNGCYGGGGGGSAYVMKYITGLTSGSTVAVTIGAQAGTSSFGAYCSATGGANGNNGSYNSQPSPGANGAGSGGDIIVNPVRTYLATLGYYIYGDAGCSCGGTSGGNYASSPGMLGGAAMGANFGNSTTTLNSTGYGNGGAGGGSNSGYQAGGAGTPGVVIVEW